MQATKPLIEVNTHVSGGVDVTQFYNKELHLIAEVLDCGDRGYYVEYFKIYGGGYNKVGFEKKAANYACGCVMARAYCEGKTV